VPADPSGVNRLHDLLGSDRGADTRAMESFHFLERRLHAGSQVLLDQVANGLINIRA
jgi:hypothetical protein